MSSNNRSKRESRKAREYEEMEAANESMVTSDIQFSPAAKGPIETLTPSQAIHKSSLIHDTMVIAIGSAGTGKTYLSAAVAADLYLGKHFKKIVLTRPNVEVGRPMGHLPGNIEDKYAPYLEPFKKGIIDRLGSTKFKCDYGKNILAKPINFLRGETFDDTVFLLDEAQNTTIEDMKCILTRIGTNSKIFISGDINQSDLRQSESGLAWLVRRIQEKQKPYDIIEYNRSDCVRSEFCRDMLDLIEN